jgi:hypothetical protein
MIRVASSPAHAPGAAPPVIQPSVTHLRWSGRPRHVMPSRGGVAVRQAADRFYGMDGTLLSLSRQQHPADAATSLNVIFSGTSGCCPRDQRPSAPCSGGPCAYPVRRLRRWTLRSQRSAQQGNIRSILRAPGEARYPDGHHFLDLNLRPRADDRALQLPDTARRRNPLPSRLAARPARCASR